MAMTLRLSAHEDETLTRLAATFNTSKNLAAAAAIDLAASRTSHQEFVRSTVTRLLQRDEDLLARLAAA